MTEQERLEKLSKLPKWVQDEIKYLTAEVRSLKETITSITSDHKDSNIRLRDLPDHQGRGLPPDETVEFHLGPDAVWEVVDVKIESGKLQIMGHGSFHIYPRASNVVEIALNR
jgi:hypothetical protein